MGKINSKEKGARFERKLSGMFRDYGYKARRTAQYCGNTGDASDVVGLPGIHIEAKHQEKMKLYEWMDQAKRDAKETSDFPVVFHKKNHAEVLVTMQFDTFMQLYKEWQISAGVDKENEYIKRIKEYIETCYGDS